MLAGDLKGGGCRPLGLIFSQNSKNADAFFSSSWTDVQSELEETSGDSFTSSWADIQSELEER
jgi:hypothetical protein